MELDDVLRRRHMVRSFAAKPLDEQVVFDLLASCLRAPSAGNTRGTHLLALRRAVDRETYWAATTTNDWRQSSRRYQGLSRAPVVVLVWTSPDEYRRRYEEPDKIAGGGVDEWPIPYWFGDAAFVTMAMLLGAVDANLAAAFLGNFRGEPTLVRALDIPPDFRLFGTVLLGHPDGRDHPSPSLKRPGSSATDRIHDGTW